MNDLYIDKFGKLLRAKSNNYSRHACERYIVLEDFHAPKYRK